MAIPDYADERSFKHFSRGFVGGSHGDNGSAYQESWDSTSGAEETKMIVDRYQHYCAYCGNSGLPLQPYFKGSFTHEGSDRVTGYACVCSGAMDEADYKQKVVELKDKYEEDLYHLKQQAPKVNTEVIKTLAENKVKKMKKDLDRKFNNVNVSLTDFGFSLTGEKDNVEF